MSRPDQLRQAMQQVQFSEEAFRQSIERTMELLKRIQVEQKMDEMVKRRERTPETAGKSAEGNRRGVVIR